MAMHLVLVSPEVDRPDEGAVVGALFAAGLERYHLRKPQASVFELERLIEEIPPKWRTRVVLHQHHELVPKHRLGGYHWKDEAGPSSADRGGPGRSPVARAAITSRSCHDLATLRASFGRFDSVFHGPVFASISKPGYAPRGTEVGEALGVMLELRNAAERRTAVLAIGGISVQTAPRALALGFDGVAVLGAVWQAADPVAAFAALRATVAEAAARRAVMVAGDAGTTVPGGAGERRMTPWCG